MKRSAEFFGAQGANRPPGRAAPAALGLDLSGECFWNGTSDSIRLQHIRKHWTKKLGITGPHWLILVAVADLDQGSGVPLEDVTARLLVDPLFIAVQSKILEKSGFLHRKEPAADARIVFVSLAEKAIKEVETMAARQELLRKFHIC
jgi:MarR family transcriptional regulator, organic hydroperoxide resistance regulator